MRLFLLFSAVVVCAILVLLSEQVCAETGPELKHGDRIRVQTKDSREEYTLERFHPDTLFVLPRGDNGLSRIATGQVERVEVKVPRSPGSGALWGAVIGAAIGGGIGAIYAIATWDEVETECGQFDDICDNTASGLRFIGSVTVFGLPGMLLGGIIGAAAPGERWQPIDFPGTVSVRPGVDGTVVFQYSRSF